MNYLPPHADVPSEADRLSVLRAYDILDTPAEPAFDDIAVLASRLCEAPIALISLIDGERQWFKARVGLDVCETGRDVAFCDHAMWSPGPMVVPDASRDERFAANPLVTGDPNIRFYAGAPLKSADGVPLGALSVVDTVPRPQGLSDTQQLALEVLARQVTTQLELRRALGERRRMHERMERALSASGSVGAWDWDIIEDHFVADDRFARLFGIDPAVAVHGGPVALFEGRIHPDDAARVHEAYQAALASNGTFEAEYRVGTDDDACWVLGRGEVYPDEIGRPARFSGTVIEITQRKRMEAELARAMDRLAESEARFRAIADSMPQMVWSTLPDGFHDYYNARWYEFTGVPPGSTDGEGWNGMFHPDDQGRAWERWSHSLTTGEPYEIEYRLRHHSGVYRWTLGRAMPIRNAAGEITRWFGTCTDIDDLKRMEQAKELLSQELSHRIKNIFAVVSALVALSARQFPEAKGFAKALRTRINALARAHEFVRPHTEASAPTVGSMTLHAFLKDLFGAYVNAKGQGRVRLTGEDAVFDDQAATSVALLFHELATNAAKYGALSVPDGHVELHTRREGDRFVLAWSEHGGPPVAGTPQRAGFGSSLARLSVEGQLGGRLEQTWDPGGLLVTVDLPSTALSRRRAAQIVA